MKRRQFLKTSIIAGGAIAGVGGGALLLVDEPNREDLNISSALKKLDYLSTKQLVHTGQWQLHKIFLHCAQSIEYSMTGFPVHKSSLFKGTVGALAFSIFSARGEMTHGLNEAIPGADPLSINLDTMAALDYLKTSLTNFANYKGSLAPHFAYGELSKHEYEVAHVMHLYNHLIEVNS